LWEERTAHHGIFVGPKEEVVTLAAEKALTTHDASTGQVRDRRKLNTSPEPTKHFPGPNDSRILFVVGAPHKSEICFWSLQHELGLWRLFSQDYRFVKIDENWTPLAASADLKRVVFVEHAGATSRLYLVDVATGNKDVINIESGGRPRAAVFTNTGSRVIVASTIDKTGTDFGGPYSCVVEGWGTGDKMGGRILQAADSWDPYLINAPANQWSFAARIPIAVSEKAGVLAFGDLNGTVHIYGLSDNRRIRVLEGHSAPITCLKFSGDGQLIASAGTNNIALVWKWANALVVAE
jgi:WD40 repeat protein